VQAAAKPRQRTVSDAAQYARNRRQSDLMKELMPAGKGGSMAHGFQLTSFVTSSRSQATSKLLSPRTTPYLHQQPPSALPPPLWC
jgi:hypothetical protein